MDEKTSADMAVESTIGKEPEAAASEDLVLCVEAAVAAAQTIAYDDQGGPGRLQDAVDTIFVAEKRARLAGELAPTRTACLAIIDLCFELGDWAGVGLSLSPRVFAFRTISTQALVAMLPSLNQNVLIISKRRAQLKQVITESVQKAMGFLGKTEDVEKQLELLETLRTVTEGKIFVEMERARLTRTLVGIKEAEGKVEEACEILQEVQVETIGTMDKREKTSYILDQMRLCLAKGDLIRTAIISKKINEAIFKDEGIQDLKVQFYHLMIEKHAKDKAYLAIAKAFYQIFDTPSVQNQLPELSHAYAGKWAEVLKCVVVFVILSSHDSEQSDFMNRVASHKLLDDLPDFKALIRKFLTSEIMQMSELVATYKDEMNSTAAFPLANQELCAERWKDVDTRVVEHNIRVIAKCYSKIRSARLAMLLDKSQDETEENLSKLVVAKSVFAKIDRPNGVVCFRPTPNANGQLNDWSADISSLLSLVERSCHLISLEETKPLM